jgi:hypothetical protein
MSDKAFLVLRTGRGQIIPMQSNSLSNFLWGHSRSFSHVNELAKAFANSCGIVPPAIAMSGLPPPLPPTCCATKFTKSPALTFIVKSGVTPAMI